MDDCDDLEIKIETNETNENLFSDGVKNLLLRKMESKGTICSSNNVQESLKYLIKMKRQILKEDA